MTPGAPKDNSGQLYAQQAQQAQALQQQQWQQEQQQARMNDQAQLAQQAQQQATLEATNKLAAQKESQDKIVRQREQAASAAAVPYENAGTATGLKPVNTAQNMIGGITPAVLPGFNQVKAKQGNSLATSNVKLGG